MASLANFVDFLVFVEKLAESKVSRSLNNLVNEMSITDVYDYVDKLKALLQKCGKIVHVSNEFNNIQENSARVRYLQNILKEQEVLVDGKLRMAKSDAIAESYRTRGNQFYGNKQFLEALECYNQSLCFAESGSKFFGLAYANRSAVYSELKLYENCLRNVELAKQNRYPTESLHKLQKREDLCMVMINNKDNLTPSNVPIGAEYLKLNHKANEKLPFIADCLEMKTSKVFGRYITTRSPLRPGDIVCSEDPFTKVLLPSCRYKYCANCLSDNFLDLIACSDCTSTMFCSQDCAQVGNEKFHKYECPIVDKLNSMGTKILRIAIRTFFEAMDVCSGNLEELKILIEENRDSSITVFDYEFPIERSSILKAIDALATNESERNQADLFQRSGIVAIICDMFLKHTSLGDVLVTRGDEDFFYCFVFKQTQIAASNYHGLFNGVTKKSEFESNNDQCGSASFPFCSLINHSCSPNLVRITSGCKNYVMINRPIETGEQLFDNYGFHHCLENFEERQVSLQNQYMFKCCCEGCIKKFPLYHDLRTIDRRFNQFIGNDVNKLSQLNIEHAKKKFQSYCDYLKKMDANYPCYEISSVQECLLRCFTIFTMSDFKLKLCGH